MKGATKVGVHSRYALTIVYDEHPDWPQLCNEGCPQLRRDYLRMQACSIFGDLRLMHTPGKSRYVRAERCIQFGPIYRCKHKQVCIPQNAAFVDGCGWQGPQPARGICPSCGSTILREVRT